MSGQPDSTPSWPVSAWSDGWFVVPHEVTWRDTDGMGHVNNAVYFTYFEWARAKYWFALNGKSGGPIAAGDLEFIVARAECDFKAQLMLGERISVRVRIGEIRTSSFDFEYEIRNERGEVAASGLVVAVLWSWERNEKRTFDAALRSRIRAFEQR